MPVPSLRWLCRLIAPASLGAMLTFVPCIVELDHSMFPELGPAAAYAKNGAGGNGKGNNGNGNSGNGNNGNGNTGNGNSNGNGSGDSDDGGDDGSSAGKSGGETKVNPATGDKVTVQGNVIEVVHPDGISERVEAGRFRMKDALGRTIIDRAVKASDVRRLKAL
ncbi:hypothetical protein CN311_18985 [Mesorhizobium sanjuanii]|uniref:Glycine-rich cell wall protein n=1 Tax=Mesorhizobium sanjuanii TaxID=2037900 RepID=A0A2A6FCS1_9HYPH|nr:hypothetical protein [Mesorhizobium sanjuanii]PDQ19543.1 hypothetical protein CN311_18985 [Mesorhizobium sanjuanii]